MPEMDKMITGLVIVGLLLAVLVGCGFGPSSSGLDVSAAETLRLWQNKEAIVIDVRTPAEYLEGHIPDVANIPLDELEKRTGEVPRDKEVVLICHSGNRSMQGTKLLRSKGFDNVFSSAGGMSAWKGPITK